MVVLTVLAAVLFWLLGPFRHDQGTKTFERIKGGGAPVPVEVAPVLHGPIELQRTFSGALEPMAEFVVAPKVSGRLERLTVNIADSVTQGQLVAELDNAEYVQAVAQAKADLAVAKANLAEAVSALGVAGRELDRVKTLRKRGVASEAQLETAEANHLAKEVEKEVAQAHVMRAEASLETANIRLGYTRITAGWSDEAGQRVVAERFVDEGEMVSANTALLRIVELNPIAGVIFITEQDYGRLQVDQPVVLTTDAFSDEKFHGHVERIAPVFQQQTRQARVELTIENAGQRLKPGMFIRVTVVLERKENTTIVPTLAITARGDRAGLFVVNEDGKSVRWQEVQKGIRNGDSIEILTEGISGQVVTLGQQMLEDGSSITIPEQEISAQRAMNNSKTP